MAYITSAEFAIFGLPPAAYAGIAPALVTAAIEHASGIADSYIAKRYTLPLTSASEPLKRAVADIAAWFVLGYRGFDPQPQNGAAAQARHDQAIAWLARVATGEVEIIGGGDLGEPLCASSGNLEWSSLLTYEDS
jgi:phage gp36-like protein